MSIVSIQLDKEDLDFITSEPDFGTEVNNTFISIHRGAISDLTENPSRVILPAEGLMASLVTADRLSQIATA